MPDLIVSNSEIQTFKQCRRKWMLNYVRGLQAPERPTGALALGTNVHEALASYYSPAGSLAGALSLLESIYVEKFDRFPLKHDELNKEYRLACTMIEGYVQWVEEEGIDSGYQIMESEREIESEILLPSGLVAVVLGKRDIIAVDNFGMKCFMDFKTCATLGDSLLDLNEQLLTYSLLHKINNPEEMPQYAEWRMLRKVLRSERAKPPFYAVERVDLSDKLLRNFYLRLIGTLEDMARTKAQLDEGQDHRFVCYPTASDRCRWGCDYRVVCPMFDRDDYAEEFLADNYEQRNPYERYQSQGVVE